MGKNVFELVKFSTKAISFIPNKKIETYLKITKGFRTTAIELSSSNHDDDWENKISGVFMSKYSNYWFV